MIMEEIKSLSRDDIFALVMEDSSAELLSMLRELINIIRSDVTLKKKYWQEPWFEKIPAHKIHRGRIVVTLIMDGEFSKAWIESLSPQAVKVLTYLTWNGKTRLDILENATGILIAESVSEHRYHKKFDVFKEFSFIRTSSVWGYRISKKSASAWLPFPFKYMAVTALPPPPGYNLHLLEKPPESEFSCRFDGSAPLSIITARGFIKEGHIALKKNGAPAVKGLKDLQKVADLDEFYKVRKGDLSYLRTGISVAERTGISRPMIS